MTPKRAIPLLLAAALIAGVAIYALKPPADKSATGVSPPTATKTAKDAPPVPVTVAPVVLGDMPRTLEVLGRSEAYESVTLKPRSDGQVTTVSFTEGQHVRKGDKLVQLDTADFAARLRQAEANLARDQAQLTRAEADVVRYVSLKQQGFVSEEKVNEVRTNAAALVATLNADRAAIDLARLQLGYTTIRSPIDGIVGAKLVFPGSVVKINDTLLAVVNRVRPLNVSFAVPEKYLAGLRAAMAKGGLKASIALPEQADRRSGDQSFGDRHFEGVVNFVDNSVDAATGTITFKARVPNEDEALLPGQFVQVSLVTEVLRNVVSVPAEAIQQGPDGSFVYVVKPDKNVEVRKVEILAERTGTVAIGRGLKPGESVVTDGQSRLTPKSRVSIKAPKSPSAKADAKPR